ncbi:MAG TPA: periplasmic heavy metal sensor [Thermoanaerobaculia bacterium]|nr:periplasmic heavy metal sensor [Thermoanaerobaculia bacterium]
MRRWWLIVALVLSLGVNIGILASLAVHRVPSLRHRPELGRERMMPQRGPGPRGGGEIEGRRWSWPQAPLTRLADHLGLSGDKRDQFIALQRQFFADTVASRRRFMETRRALHRELVAEHPDAAKIEALTKEVGKQVSELDRSMAKTVLATRKILDPEQLDTYLGFLRRIEEHGRRGPVASRRPAPRSPNGPPPGP